MRKLIFLVLVLFVATVFVGCSQTNVSDSTDTSDQTLPSVEVTQPEEVVPTQDTVVVNDEITNIFVEDKELDVGELY